jgi:hypothetical protein
MTGGKRLLILVPVVALLAILLLEPCAGDRPRPEGPPPERLPAEPDPAEPAPESPPEPPEPPAEGPAEEPDLPPDEPAPVEADLVIEGTVFRQDGETPADGGWVKVRQGRDVRYVRAGPDGRFLVDRLRPGEVHVNARPNDATAGGPKSVKVAAGERDLRIVLCPQGQVSFEIVDAVTQKPVTAPLRVIQVTEGGEMTAITATGGLPSNFEHQAVYPGRPLRYRVVADGYRPSETYVVEYRLASPMQKIRVELVPDPASMAVLTLVLSTESGEIPERVAVLRHREGGFGGRSHPVENGRLELRLPPEELDLEIDASGGPEAPWIPVRFKIRLGAGGRAVREIRFRAGGYIRVSGPGEAPPFVILFVRGELRARKTGDMDVVGDLLTKLFGPFEAGRWELLDSYGDEFEPAEAEVRVREIAEVRLKPLGEERPGEPEDD